MYSVSSTALWPIVNKQAVVSTLFLICFLSDGRSSVGAKKAPGSERVLGGLRTRATFPGAMFRAGNGSIRVHRPHEPTSYSATQQHILVQMPWSDSTSH